MKKITINITDKSKEDLIIRFLREIPFVEIDEDRSDVSKSGDFRNLYGIWKDRDITLDDLRKNAWERLNK